MIREEIPVIDGRHPIALLKDQVEGPARGGPATGLLGRPVVDDPPLVVRAHPGRREPDRLIFVEALIPPVVHSQKDWHSSRPTRWKQDEKVEEGPVAPSRQPDGLLDPDRSPSECLGIPRGLLDDDLGPPRSGRGVAVDVLPKEPEEFFPSLPPVTVGRHLPSIQHRQWIGKGV